MTLTCVSGHVGNASIGKDLKAAKPPPRKDQAEDDEQRLVERE